jgi:hypothetical protein
LEKVNSQVFGTFAFGQPADGAFDCDNGTSIDVGDSVLKVDVLAGHVGRLQAA